MLSPNRAYALGASGILISRGISAVAGVLSLWLLARILTTEQLAGYVVAMSILILVGYNASLAIERAMILRLAELPVRPEVLAGRGMLLRILAVAMALALVAMGGVLTYAQSAGPVGTWLTAMAPLILAITVGITLEAWFLANHRVGTSALMQGVTDGARCLLFAAVFLAGFGAAAVAKSAVLAAVLPIAILSFTARGRTEQAPASLHLSDLGAGLQFLVIRLSQMGLRQLDIVIVGAFAGALDTAQYAIAARMSVIASLGHSAFSTTYQPRLRRHLATGNQAAIRREFDAARLLAFLATFAAALAFYLIGDKVLGLFGDFTGAYPALVILMAGHVLTAAFSMHADHLSMSDHLGRAVLIRSGTTLVFVVALLILVPRYEILGAGLAAVVAAVTFSLASTHSLRALAGFAPRSPVLAAAASTSTGSMIAGALVPQMWTAGLCVLVPSLAAVLWAERALLTHILAKR